MDEHERHEVYRAIIKRPVEIDMLIALMKRPRSVEQLAADVGAPKTEAYRFIERMNEAGLVAFVGHYFSPGARLCSRPHAVYAALYSEITIKINAKGAAVEVKYNDIDISNPWY